MKYISVLALLLIATACFRTPLSKESGPSANRKNTPRGGYSIYVTNENSGDVSVIDSASLQVVGTIPVEKRPRGIHPSPDGRNIYVALSGSPPAPPGVDESTLPPPEKSADGIGVIGVAEG